ncbi:MAG TPA: pyridoxamine 5'-phosphate oxidase family protein [Chitinispirillaceae bacterium]|nr:pyridoxamine 5'-phosphate oxidase family protein [Chitinispirillaceae bacterium]
MKTIDEIIDFTNQNPVAWVATSVNGQPHVRAMAMWFADKTGFYFHTGSMKRLYTQLKGNPRIEAGFIHPGEMQTMQTVRVTGTIEEINDPVLQKKLFEDRPWLNPLFAAYPNDKIFIFRIAHGEAQYWDMSRNCQEKNIPAIVF